MTLREVHKYIVITVTLTKNDIRDITNGFEYASSLAGVDAVLRTNLIMTGIHCRLTPKVKSDF